MKPITAALFLTLFLCACVSPGDRMNEFVGQPSSELIAKLGQPFRRFAVGKRGDEIWCYMVQQGWGRFEKRSRTAGVDTTFHRFYVNRDGIVDRYDSYAQEQ
jgi:hypothetical protein